jgi:hypothetical protein
MKLLDWWRGWHISREFRKGSHCGDREHWWQRRRPMGSVR